MQRILSWGGRTLESKWVARAVKAVIVLSGLAFLMMLEEAWATAGDYAMASGLLCGLFWVSVVAVAVPGAGVVVAPSLGSAAKPLAWMQRPILIVGAVGGAAAVFTFAMAPPMGIDLAYVEMLPECDSSLAENGAQCKREAVFEALKEWQEQTSKIQAASYFLLASGILGILLFPVRYLCETLAAREEEATQ